MSQISNGSKVMILGWPHTALWCCLASTFKSCNERSQVLNQAVPQNLPFQLHLLPFSSHCMRLPLHFTVMMVLDEWWGDSCQTECFVWQLKTSVLFSSHHRIFCLMLSGLHVLFFFFSFGNLQAHFFHNWCLRDILLKDQIWKSLHWFVFSEDRFCQVGR